MTDAMLSGNNCPSCGKPLKMLKDGKQVSVWCGNGGGCHSKRSGWGAIHDTEQEAFDELKRRIDDERLII